MLVRTCEKTYNEQMILEAGIKIIDIEFPDGASPPKHVIKHWLQIVKNQFGPPPTAKAIKATQDSLKNNPK